MFGRRIKKLVFLRIIFPDQGCITYHDYGLVVHLPIRNILQNEHEFIFGALYKTPNSIATLKQLSFQKLQRTQTVYTQSKQPSYFRIFGGDETIRGVYSLPFIASEKRKPEATFMKKKRKWKAKLYMHARHYSRYHSFLSNQISLHFIQFHCNCITMHCPYKVLVCTWECEKLERIYMQLVQSYIHRFYFSILRLTGIIRMCLMYYFLPVGCIQLYNSVFFRY